MFENYSLWDRLAEHKKPILIYGTGNGADKIIDALARYGVAPDAVFASDGFVRERTFRGYPVRSYSDVIDQFGSDVTILLAFGTTLQSVRDFIDQLDRRHELLIPDVPLYGGELFDYGYFSAHTEELEKALSELSDDRSKNIFRDAVNFRLTGKIKYLADTEPLEETLLSLFAESTLETVLDGGAFKGDSTGVFASVLHPDTIYAVEADTQTYKKLCVYAENETRSKVIPVNAALSDADGIESYVSSASRGSGESGQNRRAKVIEIEKKKIDTIINGKMIDFIKLDVEGDELKSLFGAKMMIEQCKPSLAVSLYHRTEDLFSLIDYVHGLLPEHKLYLRRVPCIPMWDLALYAIKKA